MLYLPLGWWHQAESLDEMNINMNFWLRDLKILRRPYVLGVALYTAVFRKLKGVSDTFTTTSHYSLSRLNVIEAVVLSLVSQEFTVAPGARRWLDDDEFLVRRRIHREVRAALEKAGL